MNTPTMRVAESSAAKSAGEQEAALLCSAAKTQMVRKRNSTSV